MQANDLVIESGIEIPPAKNGRSLKYPVDQMEVGDSIYFDSQYSRSSVITCARTHAKNTGKKFISREWGEGFRIWRTQ